MPRPSTGSVVTLRRKRGTIFALRFRAYGERRYVTLGSAEDGWDRERAEATLRRTLADVERGIWRPPVAPEHTEPQTEPTLHEFATDWLAEKEPELAPKTVLNYRWALSNHLLPALADLRLSELTAAQIDRFKADKLREGKLAPGNGFTEP